MRYYAPMHPAMPQAAEGTTPGTIAGFLDEVRQVCRLRHLSIHTEDSYLQTIRRFIVFHDKKHPARLGAVHRLDVELSGHATPGDSAG